MTSNPRAAAVPEVPSLSEPNCGEVAAPLFQTVSPAGTVSADAASPQTASSEATVLSSDAEVEAYLHDHAAGGYRRVPADQRWSEARWREAHKTDDDATAFQRAHKFGLPLINLASLKFDASVIKLVPPAAARRYRFVPVAKHADVLGIAVEDPADSEIFSALNFLTGRRVSLLVATPHQIQEAIAANYDRAEDEAIAHQLGLSDAPKLEEEYSEQLAQRLALEQPIVRLVAEIFANAVRRRASDIHLRPGEDEVELLYRIDGELVPVRSYLRSLQPSLTSRIKVLGSMNLAEHRIPQDGRATYEIQDGHAVDLRISILPTIHGESVAIRLLDTMQSLREIGELGFSTADEARFHDLIARDHGMILVTGPTGSGKSTTLYAALLEARKERVNILTVEDPVEFHIAGVQQTQVNRAAGFTFAGALRNFLRHDPDVIMVGEIRDRETAQIAVEGALTGHLLLSTLHTNTAATTITRLLDLDVESFLLRSTLLGVLSQRLTRRNCPHCLEPEIVPAHWRTVLQVGESEVFYRGRGCHQCDGLGVHGRISVYELMRVTPAIRKLIQPHCDADAIHETALREGMVAITDRAVELARAGTISLSEAFRLRTE